MRWNTFIGQHRGTLLLFLVLAASLRNASAQTNSASATPLVIPQAPPLQSWEKPFLPPTNPDSPAPSAAASSAPAPVPPSQSPDSSLSLHPPSPVDNSAADPPSLSDRFSFPEGNPDQLPAHLLVVYNNKDPASHTLATYYASRRKIPPERVLGIACPLEEEINRKQYEETIRGPIISYLYHQGWMVQRPAAVHFEGRDLDLLVATHNDIWAIVLMRGVPLRIAASPAPQPGMENASVLETDAAAVDSELALLPISGLPLGGFVPNIFFDRTGSGLVRAGPELATKIILVTRLDGPRPADVHRMIDDTIWAEENRLAGLAVIDTRGLTDSGNPFTSGDDWLRTSRKLLAKAGWSIRFDDDPAVIPAKDPLNHVAIYLGWYNQGACGPWINPPNRFVRGAIAYHLHSFSATTVRSLTDAWVGPLILHGAAATMGCVYEPYLDLTPHLDVFTRRLLQGNSFAEAAYASQKGLSWMTTVVGDPLYHPFRKSVEVALTDSTASPASDHYDWLLVQQAHQSILRQEIPLTITSLQHYLDVPGSVAQEGLGDLLQNINDPAGPDAARRAYGEASNLASQPIDRIRIGLKIAQLDEKQGRAVEAQNELRILRDLDPIDAAVFGVPAASEATVNPAQLTIHRDTPSELLMSVPPPPAPPKPTPAAP